MLYSDVGKELELFIKIKNMITKTAYILIGDNDTGKTTFQKYLIWHLCEDDKFSKLNTNLIHHIKHRDSQRKLRTLFTMNRSMQEKMADTYETIDNYFRTFFKDADVCILSSHSHNPCIDDIRQMIVHLNNKYYNVSAVFFSNHLNTFTEEISQLNWQERILIDNSYSVEHWEDQINKGARYFSDMIIRKAIRY
jgi:hypothetical protein